MEANLVYHFELDAHRTSGDGWSNENNGNIELRAGN